MLNFREGSGNIAYDESAAANHGYLGQGIPWGTSPAWGCPLATDPTPTAPVVVRLRTAGGQGLSGGIVSYQSPGGIWLGLGTTGANGEASGQVPSTVTKFRMSYAGRSVEKTQALGAPVEFVTTRVELRFSDSIEYSDEAGGWIVYQKPAMELLPGSYTFRFGTAGTLPFTVGAAEVRKSVAAAKLVDSAGAGLASGAAQYYLAGWRNCTNNPTNAAGVAFCVFDGAVGSLQFSMDYAFSRGTVTQDIAQNSYVVFRTVSVLFALKDSAGNALDTGTAQYYSSGWRPVGTTVSGQVRKELLPGTFDFAMDYAYTRQQKRQDIGVDAVVVFQTRQISVRLNNSAGAPLGSGTAQYYASGWRAFGAIANGESRKELFAGTYPFSVDYSYSRQEKSQNVESDPVVVFQTRQVVVQLKDSTGNPLSGGTAQYYSSGWRTLGAITGGEARAELFGASYNFAVDYAYTRAEKTQDIAADGVVVFQTRRVSIEVRDSAGNLLEGSAPQYYGAGWRGLGSGSAELFGGTYNFAVTYNYTRAEKQQNVAANPVVAFQTRAIAVQLRDHAGAPLEGGSVQLYSSGWRSLGVATGGALITQLFPGAYNFAMNYGYGRQEVTADTNATNDVVFRTGLVTSASATCISYYAAGWRAFTNGMQLMAGSYLFRFSDGTADTSTAIGGGAVNTIH